MGKLIVDEVPTERFGRECKLYIILEQEGTSKKVLFSCQDKEKAEELVKRWNIYENVIDEVLNKVKIELERRNKK